MGILAGVVIGICLTGFVFCMWMLKRNQEVYRFRMRLLDEEHSFILLMAERAVRTENRKLLDNVSGNFMRYNSLPSYNFMVYHFWKPLSSFEVPLSQFYKDIIPV